MYLNMKINYIFCKNIKDVFYMIDQSQFNLKLLY